MATVEDKFFKTTGTELHYVDWGGEGRPVLFLTGMGCSAHIYDSFVPILTPRFHAIGLTRRGHGQSALGNPVSNISVLSDDIAGLLDHLNLERVSIVAHSFGCAEASSLCASYPDRVEAVVLLDGGYDYRTFRQVIEKDPLAEASHPTLDDAATEPDFFNRVRLMRPDLDAIWHELSASYLRDFVQINKNGFVEERVIPETYSALQDILFSYEPEWHKHRVPLMSVFAMWDVADYAMPEYLDASQREKIVEYIAGMKVPAQRASIQNFREQVPRAKVEIIPEGHHYCFLSDKDSTARLVESFLTQRD